MSKILTIYLQAPASIFGRMVSHFTASPIAHTFASIGNGFYLEADFFGVRLFDEKEFKKRKILRVYELKNPTLFATADRRLDVALAALFLKAQPYDYLLTLSFLAKRLINMPRAYNCVEAVKYLLDSLKIKHNISGKDRPCDLVKLEQHDAWQLVK